MNGLNPLNRKPIVTDTMVFLRMLSNRPSYVDLLQKIKQTCNRIVISTPIAKEWMSKAHVEGMTPIILLTRIGQLKRIDKLRKCGKSMLDKAKKLIEKKKCRKPKDRYDMKFLEAALAEDCTLITEDQALLALNPYRCGQKNFVIVTPEDYMRSDFGTRPKP